jgi:wyosine [tRNA(Phe)-imidazoG37] synthetase (radical SAM superfamily)
MRIDSDIRQDLAYVDFGEIEARAPKIISRYEGNRLVRHLVENCALCYGCPAARNFVLGRWECPVPTSRQCNAACVGCISAQPAGTGVRPAQDRIAFVPTADEIIQFTVPHLEEAEDPVISFGQGCEGEPLLYSGLLEEAIRGIRKETSRGVINLNTNGSLPDAVERLCTAGLDSIRISLNSAQKDLYNRYYRQRSYAFEDVLESIRTAGERNVWVSLNYFIFPGLTDRQEETASLFRLLEEGNIDMIQTRNINIDPYMYFRILGFERAPDSGAGGMRSWLGEVRRRFPHIRLGYFNPGREVIASSRG